MKGKQIEGNAWRWLTRRFEEATSKSVARVTGRADADGHVIDHEALRADAAGARTRVSAFLSEARSIAAALGVHGALRPTIRRATDVILHTRAGGHARVAAVAASGERTAGRRHARIRRRLSWRVLV